MSRNYYYLSASLPMLSFSQKPSLTLLDFLGECERLLEKNDFQKLNQVLNDTTPAQTQGSGVFGLWVRFNRDFRNEMAYFRAQRAGKDPQKYLRGDRNSESWMQDVIAQAAKAPDPLSAEKILDAARFEFLEKLSAGHFMNFDFILTYGLKLKMIHRYQEIESAQGKDIFEQLKKVEVNLN